MRPCRLHARRLTRLVAGASLLAVALPTVFAQVPVSPAPAAAAAAGLSSGPATQGLAIGQLQFVVPNPDERIEQLILRDESAEQVLALLERLTGRIVLRPQGGVAAAITINAAQPMTKLETVTALETLLAMNGIGIAPLGEKFLKVIQLAQVRSEAPELYTGSLLGLPPSGRVVARLFQPTFLRVNELQAQVVPLLNPTAAQVLPLERANSIIILDAISNLQRVETLLQHIDKPAALPVDTKFYQVRFAKASEIANRLRTLASGPLQALLSSTTVIDADDRTNQVILTTDKRQFGIFDDLVAKFDIQADPNTRNELIPLKNADAKEVASILSQLVSGQKSSATEAARPGQNVAAAAQAQGGPPPPDGGASAGSANASALGVTGENAQFSKLLTILPDTRSNGLVVSGTVDDIRLIRNLIEKLDTVLPQVRIEVVIASVSYTDEYRTGLQAVGLQYDQERFGAATGSTAKGPGWRQVGGSISDAGAASGSTGIPGLVFSGNIKDRTLAVAVQSLPGPSRARLLATPVIVTSHNKEATFFAGESRPIVSTFSNGSTSTGVSTGTVPSGNVTYRDAGIDITVKPLIGADGTIQLDIQQKFDAFSVQSFNISGIGEQPGINRRETKSFVTVADGNVIVLSGLQREDISKSRSRWGPIPLLQDLLGGRSSKKDISELLVFIRPTIVHDLKSTTTATLDAIKRMEDPDARKKLQDTINPPPPAPPKPEPENKPKAFFK